jgi:hypothetical protein
MQGMICAMTDFIASGLCLNSSLVSAINEPEYHWSADNHIEWEYTWE